jgi:trehalose 6-phosphate phosphatase
MQEMLPNIDWSGSALFLDVDGTVLDIREHPDDVRADNGLVVLLQQISECLAGAFALVSGRPIAELDRIFSPARFVAVGAHGAESRGHSGVVSTNGAAVMTDSIKEQASEFAEARAGLMLEKKNYGIALHYRQAPEYKEDCREFMRSVARDIRQDFRLIEGKMVLELMPHSHNKGDAIREMLKKDPFSGRRPVFAGDDVTDEDGFTQINSVSGVSIRVGQADVTAALYVLEDVSAVRAWLEAIPETFPG